MAKTLRCPISNAILEFRELSTGSHQVHSPVGWSSRLFSSYAEAYDWAEAINVKDARVERVQKGIHLGYFVLGPGWRSKKFDTEDSALYWSKHRKGRPMKSAVKPVRVQVREVEEPEEIDQDQSPEYIARDMYKDMTHDLKDA